MFPAETKSDRGPSIARSCLASYTLLRMSEDLLTDLNDEQRAAVTYGEGPLFISAGVKAVHGEKPEDV